MAEKEHLARLKQGVEAWDRWREENPDLKPDLSDAKLERANLGGADLSGVDLYGAILIGVDLTGANLSDADLTGADLYGAILIGVDLSGIDLSGVDFSGVDFSGVDFSKIDLYGVDFSELNLRGAILSKMDFSEIDLCGADLRGAILSGADLSEIDLSEIDLSGAILSEVDLYGAILSGLNLSGADLSGASLAIVQARGTDFRGATLTGACIQDWHINADTKLDDVVCEYIYLKQGKEERRPSDPSQTFALGEFTKLFQKAQETLDLIFRNGVDWKAFAYAFQQLQIENEADELAIASIENKGNGVVVIRIKAAPTADRPKLHGDFMQVYEVVHKTLEAQYQARLEDKDKHINQLFALVQSSQSQNSEVTKRMADTPKFNFNAPVGNVADTVQAGGKMQAIQHNYAAETKQNLAEAAKEIQDLLYQLSLTNPSSTDVVAAVHQEIRRNPTLKARLISALKAGGLEALKSIFDHPLFSIPAETVKGWLEAE